MSHPQAQFRHTTFHDNSVLATRRNTIASTTLKTQLDQLRATGRYTCFELKWHPIYDDTSKWPVPKHLFWDSDIAKWIEAACYFLESHYDQEIDEAVQYLVGTIRHAQQHDGYLNLHYTMVEPNGRWTNIRDMHELYNAGHLIEAALAHNKHYKNDLLLDPMLKYVKLIDRTFGPEDEKLHGYPGHPEIELALFRLYAATGDKSAYKLARYFVEERGNPNGQCGKQFYEWEAEQRLETPWKRPDAYPVAASHWYNQSHLPILEQETIEGHAVRALYLLTAVADMACITAPDAHPLENSQQWLKTLHQLWANMVDKKMYVTGGLGAMEQWEGFGIDYFLPQSTDEGGCYAETCASIACIFLAERMLVSELDGRYGDMMELSLYNNVLTAMSLDGKSFTYVNQLGSSEKDKNGREEWFWCACCPPNFSRLFGSLGGYLWHFGEEDSQTFINVHLYTSATLTFETTSGRVALTQSTNWPWEGTIDFSLEQPADLSTTIRMRIPGWANNKFSLEPSPREGTVLQVRNGYLILDPDYVASHATFSLRIHNFEPRWTEPHPYTNQNIIFLARGPIIYCADDAQNPWETNHFKDVVIKQGEIVREETRTWAPTGEMYVDLHTTCWRRTWNASAVGSDPTACLGGIELGDERQITYVPYYMRANAGGNGHMRVGMIKGPDRAANEDRSKL